MVAIFDSEGLIGPALVFGAGVILAVAILLDKLSSFVWRKFRPKKEE